MTLKFLGWVDADLLDAARNAVASVASHHHRAEVALGDVGAFPTPIRPRVLWIGLDDPKGLLPELAADLDAAFRPLGIEPEARSFTSHLTLARFKVPRRRAGDLPALAAKPPGPWTVDRIRLWRSHLSPHGARYEPLADAPLA